MSVTAATRLSDAALLEAWEEAESARPVERALALARAGSPQTAREEIERWSIGRRDQLLLDTHAATFGDGLAALTTCPECSEPLELSLRASELRTTHGDSERLYELAAGGRRVRFRLPSSRDLIEAASAGDTRTARSVLLERCLVDPQAEGAELSDDLIGRLEEHMTTRDPQSDVRLALACPDCGHAWSLTFDIADFLWREVDERARTLLSEIVTLAAAFGWEERAILALGQTRRAHYLQLVGG